MVSNVTILGAGNVAQSLGGRLVAQGFNIEQVFSRTEASAKNFAALVNANFTTDLQAITPSADIYIIAVKDDAISEIAQKLPFANKLVVHTSGAVDVAVLERFEHRGVLYPFQTFTKTRTINWENLPLFIEGAQEIFDFAKQLSAQVLPCDSAKRRKLHLAGVWANNFVNAVYGIGEHILQEAGFEASVLFPLITETASKFIDNGSAKGIQTGPAIRRDFETMNKHQSLLTDTTQKELYQLLSQLIMKNN